jgi:protein-L-isoaspartate(D-aspartate) O-methyltransferase
MNISDVARARFNMIEQQIRPWNVLDAHVLSLLADVQREAFVPAAHQALAFADMEIALGHGQFMLAPRLEARMLQDLQIQPEDKVLEIGTGSGFMAALLARQGRSVLSLERIPALAAIATQNLRRAGVFNVDVRVADGAQPVAGNERFDAIVLSGSVSKVPKHLLDLLTIGGRLITIAGAEPIMQAHLVTRIRDTALRRTTPWDANAPRLHGFAEDSHFHF